VLKLEKHNKEKKQLMNIINKMEKEKQCKAITMNNRQCTNRASLGDYCVTHFGMIVKKKKEKRGNENKRRT